jgi:hypothetical protein
MLTSIHYAVHRRHADEHVVIKEHASAGPAFIGTQLSFHALPLRPTTAMDALPLPPTSAGALPLGPTTAMDALPSGPATEGAHGTDALPSGPTTAGGRGVVAYVCETAGVQGKFLMDRALTMGVPKGPLCGKLKKGEAVTLPDGRVIQPGAHTTHDF